MAEIKKIVVHCSASESGDVDIIREWHIKGNGWRDIGYNIVIYNGYLKNAREYNALEDGHIVEARGLDFNTWIDGSERGAHTYGFNHETVGICLIGDEKFSLRQLTNLYYFCKTWEAIVPGVQVIGHYEVNPNKSCPNIDMDTFRRLLSHNTPPNEINMKEFIK